MASYPNVTFTQLLPDAKYKFEPDTAIVPLTADGNGSNEANCNV